MSFQFALRNDIVITSDWSGVVIRKRSGPPNMPIQFGEQGLSVVENGTGSDLPSKDIWPVQHTTSQVVK